MTFRLGPLVVEAAEPVAVSRFWEAALGGQACRRLMTIEPERRAKVVKNRVHLDVYVRDLASLLALGAVVLDEYLPVRATLADVEGNEFCAFLDPGLEAQPPARAFAVCTDSDRPVDLAAWWAPRVGATIGDGPDGTPRYLSECAGWPGLIWKFVEVSDERSAPNRWRWSIASRGEPIEPLVDPDGNDYSLVSEPDRGPPAG